MRTQTRSTISPKQSRGKTVAAGAGNLAQGFEIAGVTFRAKSKSCGKENCGQCPHGPFWYAFVPWFKAKAQGRLELYLGREINNAELLKRVGPALCPEARQAFEHQVKLAMDRDRLAEVESEWHQIGDELSRIEVEYVRNIEALQKRKRSNEKEQTQLRERIKAN